MANFGAFGPNAGGVMSSIARRARGSGNSMLGSPYIATITLAANGVLDLAKKTNSRLNLTGAGTVASFGKGRNQLKFLRWGAVQTITNSAAIACPLGVDLTTEVGGTAIARSDEFGNWSLFGYQGATAAGNRTLIGAAPTSNPTFTGLLTSTGVLLVSDTTEASGGVNGSGSIVTSGGANIGKALKVNSTTGATSLTAASGIFGGGIAVAEKAFIGGEINQPTTSTSTLFNVNIAGQSGHTVANGAQSPTLATSAGYWRLIVGESLAAGSQTNCNIGFNGLQMWGSTADWVTTFSTTPGAGLQSFGDSGGGAFKIYNNTGGNRRYNVYSIRIA